MDRNAQEIRTVLSLGAKRAAFISPKDIPADPRFYDSCHMNQCGQFGKKWSCPPACGEAEKMIEKMREYENGVVFQADYPFADIFDYEAMEEGAKEFYDLCGRIRRAPGLEDHMVIGAGACRECAECTYPDRACRKPSGPVLSLESYAVDVTGMCAKAGLPYIISPDLATYTGLVLFG